MGKIAFTGFAISALTTFQYINTSFQCVDNFTGVLEEIFFFQYFICNRHALHELHSIPYILLNKWYEYGRRKTGLRRQRSTPNRFHDPQKPLIFLVYSMKSHIKKSYFFVYKTNVASPQNPLWNCNSAIEATEAQFSRFSQLYGKSCYLKSWTSWAASQAIYRNPSKF